MKAFTPIEIAIDEWADLNDELINLHHELENLKEFAGVCCGMACSCYDNLVIDIANKNAKCDALLLEIQLAQASLKQL